MCRRSSIVVVGIGGATRSGKSTLAQSLQKTYPGSIVIHADRYWHIRKPYVEELQMENWELPEAVDYDMILKAIHTAIDKLKQNESEDQTRYVFVEGFLLYASTKIDEILAKRIFLTIGKRTCFERRQATKPVPTIYFDRLLWPGFIANNSSILNRTDILILDGEQSPEQILAQALDYLNGKHVVEARSKHEYNLSNNENLQELYERFERLLQEGLESQPDNDARPHSNNASSRSSICLIL